MQEARITQVRDTNPRGFGLLKDIAALRDDFRDLGARITAFEGDFAASKDGFHHRIAVLEKGCKGFRQMRGRYLDTYRRDVLRNLSPDGQARIKDGNLVAHDPDAVNDAYLFTSRSRTDVATTQEFYGIEPSEISLIGEWFSFLLH
jgi:hypothetical protein